MPTVALAKLRAASLTDVERQESARKAGLVGGKSWGETLEGFAAAASTRCAAKPLDSAANRSNTDGLNRHAENPDF
jgi:hypothetical protein